MTISQSEIEARAKRLGFSFVGFSLATQTPNFPQYLDFISNHEISDLSFLSQEYVIKGRQIPASLVENAKSVIVLGVCYTSKNSPQEQTANVRGTISAYAVLPDYHKLIEGKATTLMKGLEQTNNATINWRIFIDSGPVMEKDMAFAAGLGWIGKHTLCIHPDYGSFFFICCILTDLDLAELKRNPIQDLCGICTECERACPTGCIDAHHIELTRCISYLTTVHHGIIPRDLRSHLGTHVFGCDVCQTVCPHNKTTAIPENGYFFHVPNVASAVLNLPDELNHTPQTFKENYFGTPVLRIGFERYLRNAIIAAGNSVDSRCVPALKRLVFHNSDLIAIHAVWALSKFADRNLKNFLIDLLESEISEPVADEIRALVTD